MLLIKRMGDEANPVLNPSYDSTSSVTLRSFDFLVLLPLIKLGE